MTAQDAFLPVDFVWVSGSNRPKRDIPGKEIAFATEAAFGNAASLTG